MSHQLLENLKIANREFQEFIDQVACEGTKALKCQGAFRRLDKLNHRLQQVSKHLSTQSRRSLEEPEGAIEIMKYGENLKTLRTVIQNLHVSLLAEKTRLDNARANLQSACAWADSLREIS